MIPIRLTLKGLFSYRSEQTIDFESLTSAHLFGIFGPVGCGKSSILDAITYSLYGETERLNSRDNRSYNMMNLKSDELFIRFDFKAGNDGCRYRTEVRGKRNKKRHEDVHPYERSAYRMSEDNLWVPVEVSDLPQIIGLSYANFKRTIIIPQGKFQEFLQLGSTDRTRMMRELFNLDKFELSSKADALDKENEASLQQIRGQLLQLGEITPEKREQLLTVLSELNEKVSRNEQLLKDQIREEQVMNRLSVLFDQVAGYQKAMLQFKADEERMALLEKSLDEYEYCVRTFRAELNQHQGVVERLTQLDKVRKEDETSLSQENLQMEKLKADFQVLKPQYEQKDRLKQHLDDLNRVIRIKSIEQELAELGTRLKRGEELVKEVFDRIEANGKIKNELNLKLKSGREQLPDAAVLLEVQKWYTVLEGHESLIKERNHEMEILDKELSSALSRFMTSALQQLPEEVSIDTWKELLEPKKRETQKRIEELESGLEQLMLRTPLQSFADHLEEGKACPLCGSVHHPNPLERDVHSRKMDQLRSEKNERGNQLASLLQLDLELTKQHAAYDMAIQRRKRLTSQIEELRRVIALHNDGFRWPQYPSTGILSQEIEKARKQNAANLEIEKTLSEISLKEEKDRTDLERYRDRLKEIEKLWQTLNSEKNLLVQQLQVIEIDHYQSKEFIQIQAELDSRQFQLGKLENDFKLVEQQIEKTQGRIRELQGRLSSIQDSIKKEEESKAQLVKQLDQLLLSSSYTSVDQINAILLQSHLVDEERTMIKTYRNSVQETRIKLTEAENEIGGRVYDRSIHNALKDEIRQNEEARKSLQQEIGRTNDSIEKLNQNLDKQAGLLLEMKKLELRSDEIKTLKQLFSRSGFVRYVSTVHLQNLSRAANERFTRLVHQRLSLEVNDENDFQVRDLMNGGKIRSVKTLSGGQTFQAALSLALALADNIQQFAVSKQNFFFLDEGFGSLDRESLETVFDTLKSLKHENRIVGVISHVEEMQQEIDTYLRVINTEADGSLILAGQ